VVICDMRGQVEIVGLSSCRIPWPVGMRGRATPLVLCGALAKAVRREATVAVAYWWGISARTVTLWRRAFGVGPTNSEMRRPLSWPFSAQRVSHR
jgi:hypothetical protein